MIRFIILLTVISFVHGGKKEAALGLRTEMCLGWINSCQPVPSHLCAQVYDDDDCGGWKLEVPTGEVGGWSALISA